MTPILGAHTRRSTLKTDYRQLHTFKSAANGALTHTRAHGSLPVCYPQRELPITSALTHARPTTSVALEEARVALRAHE